ncbi:anti-sigma factor [Bythopirellula goksoeyrii]|uniref:Anti-sigma-K factor rskA n=1 Tax=Bythopirellula goksoeyrii TaxID=1400387 RepID=A0A5B9QC37_9BACT|nr:zf-HC2 domain-containing protein [Bythopirellula goksoeyrii]QEG36594.1 hypothetical protein Pr1d_39090 [Bythopirellula goksoeyrii]
MNCEDRKDLLLEYALGQLNPSAEAEMRNHLDGGCKVCSRELAEISAAWASLGVSLDSVDVPLSVEKRIMSKILSDANQSSTVSIKETVVLPERSNEQTLQRSIMPYVLAASLLGAVTAALCWKLLPEGIDVASSPKQETWGDAALEPNSPGFHTVGLKPLASKEGITLSIVRNEAVKQWHVLAAGLPATDPKSVVQLWAELKSGDFVRLASLPVSEHRTASAVIDLTEGSSEYSGLWLTVEDTDSEAHPGDNVLFRGIIE